MKKKLQIITAPFSETPMLINNEYICVSIIGKVYGKYRGIEEIKRISSLNTFRHYYHIKANDFYACNILYREILNKKGVDRILQDLNNLALEQNKNKIALCGYGEDNDFCYRHILSDYLKQNGVAITELTEIEQHIQKAYWRENNYKEIGQNRMSQIEVINILEKCTWIYAKTMPNNPHFYTLRSDLGNNLLFLNLVSHIRHHGIDEVFQGVLYRVYYFEDNKYWTMPEDLTNEDCDLINRKVISKAYKR